ncbi:MAG: hypothetical protein HYV35_08660 [Lentisphaerae bacterium]|nr:hypothetical protein [Lentisphaerota bacterium]
MKRDRRSASEAEPYDVQAHHLACAVCVRGGCKSPPCGRATARALLDALWAYPHVPLRIKADLDVARAHFFDVYARRGDRPLPSDFQARHDAYGQRRKDLEVCRLLGIYPNTVIPAFHAYRTLLTRQPTLDGLCWGLTADPAVWPECPRARQGYYEKIASVPFPKLKEQTARGEALAGEGFWALFRPRTRAAMRAAKRASVARIARAERLYIRPNHALCIICTRRETEPLIEDNLVELRRRMETEPDILVTLTEGCCMVCDPCNVYHPGEHLCYAAHPKNVLRDLRMLEMLGLKPGATLPARELYRLIFARIHSLKSVCGWGDGTDYAPLWAPCGRWRGTALADAQAEGFPKRR